MQAHTGWMSMITMRAISKFIRQSGAMNLFFFFCKKFLLQRLQQTFSDVFQICLQEQLQPFKLAGHSVAHILPTRNTLSMRTYRAQYMFEIS